MLVSWLPSPWYEPVNEPLMDSPKVLPDKYIDPGCDASSNWVKVIIPLALDNVGALV